MSCNLRKQVAVWIGKGAMSACASLPDIDRARIDKAPIDKARIYKAHTDRTRIYRTRR